MQAHPDRTPTGPHAQASAPPLLIAPQREFRSGLLVSVSLLGMAYVTWIYLQGHVIERPLWDATLGVLLGLYICSRPITNLMDMIYTQNIRWQDLRQKAGLRWIVLNFLTTFIGWATIVVGATQMVRPE